MESNTIVCNIQPFDIVQTIHITDYATSILFSSDMEHLSLDLYSAAIEHKAERILIYGHPEYAQKILHELKQIEQNNTYNEKVRVYLNGQICN